MRPGWTTLRIKPPITKFRTCRTPLNCARYSDLQESHREQSGEADRVNGGEPLSNHHTLFRSNTNACHPNGHPQGLLIRFSLLFSVLFSFVSGFRLVNLESSFRVPYGCPDHTIRNHFKWNRRQCVYRYSRLANL